MPIIMQRAAIHASAVGLALLFAAAQATAAAAPSVGPAATIDSGVVLGVSQTDAVNAWLGIPYAAQPVGALRWKATQPAAAWKEPLAAREFGAACPQPEDSYSGNTPKVQDEACLSLNVWAPAQHDQPLPVMVWLHGGANRIGASSLPYYDGHNLAKRGVVLVSVNYRLGYLGFFAHAGLAGEGGGANFALQDQIAALQWVKRNVAAFGGDPRNVTLFGESAGGADTLYLMTSPAATGLFHKAIVQSGGGWNRPLAREKMSKRVAANLKDAGIAAADAAALRALKPQQLIEALSRDKAMGFGPFVDGATVTEAPAAAFAAGRAAKVPLIIGSNDWEASLAAVRGTGLIGKILARVPPFTGWYEGDLDGAQREPLMFRDIIFAAPARWVAAAQSKQAPAWLYRFDYVTSGVRAKAPGAGHGAEIPYVFDNVGITPKSAAASDAEDRAMAAKLADCWAAFARGGKPACALTKWNSYDAAKDELLLIHDGHAAMAPAPQRKALDGALEWFGPGTVLGGG